MTVNYGYRQLSEAADEMLRSVKLWGEQNHPDYPELGLYIARTADVAKELTEEAFEGGWGTWAHILQEEWLEALDEARAGNVENLRTELIQVAAVALNWVEAIDRRTALEAAV